MKTIALVLVLLGSLAAAAQWGPGPSEIEPTVRERPDSPLGETELECELSGAPEMIRTAAEIASDSSLVEVQKTELIPSAHLGEEENRRRRQIVRQERLIQYFEGLIEEAPKYSDVCSLMQASLVVLLEDRLSAPTFAESKGPREYAVPDKGFTRQFFTDGKMYTVESFAFPQYIQFMSDQESALRSVDPQFDFAGKAAELQAMELSVSVDHIAAAQQLAQQALEVIEKYK